MPELTQEQIDAMIAEKVAEVKKGLFTEEDLNKKVMSEVDRRVESGIQKGIETQRKKWEEEFLKTASMTAEEKARKEFEEKQQSITAKEKEILRKANLTDAKELLADAEIPKAQYNDFLAVLVTDDSEATKANVEKFVAMYKSTRSEIETQVKTTLSKIPPPDQGQGDKPVDKESFNKMGYADKMKFKQKYPEIYNGFMK